MKPTFGSSNNLQDIKEIERIERNVIAPTDSQAVLVASTEQPQSKKSNGKQPTRKRSTMIVVQELDKDKGSDGNSK